MEQAKAAQQQQAAQQQKLALMEQGSNVTKEHRPIRVSWLRSKRVSPNAQPRKADFSQLHQPVRPGNHRSGDCHQGFEGWNSRFRAAETGLNWIISGGIVGKKYFPYHQTDRDTTFSLGRYFVAEQIVGLFYDINEG